MTALIDETKAEAFGEQLLGILSSGTLALMISIGHRTKLFDTLAGLPGATSDELARAAHTRAGRFSSRKSLAEAPLQGAHAEVIGRRQRFQTVGLLHLQADHVATAREEAQHVH